MGSSFLYYHGAVVSRRLYFLLFWHNRVLFLKSNSIQYCGGQFVQPFYKNFTELSEFHDYNSSAKHLYHRIVAELGCVLLAGYCFHVDFYAFNHKTILFVKCVLKKKVTSFSQTCKALLKIFMLFGRLQVLFLQTRVSILILERI